MLKIMFCGDASQTDLQKTNEKNGILDFMKIIEQMPEDFAMIEFDVNDIVRSGLVREYLVRKCYGYVMFIVENHLGDLELEKKETDGLRLYKLPSNEWVPSITSVTSFYNREVFREWRKRVGNEEQTVLQKSNSTWYGLS